MNTDLEKVGQQWIEREAHIAGTNVLNQLSTQIKKNSETLEQMSEQQILATDLGLKETPEMLLLRKDIIELIKSEEKNPWLWDNYRILAEEIINVEKEGVDGKENADFRLKKQIALIILNASMYLEGGEEYYYKEDMDEVLMIAMTRWFDEIEKRVKRFI